MENGGLMMKEIKFSLWLDFIERGFLENEFPRLLDTISGATSNPAIFKEAILTSPAYKNQLAKLSGSPKAKYEALAIADIQKAADILRPIFEQNSLDGYVSLEVDPRLAHDAFGTIEEAKRLFKAINRPNVMIKVPVTDAGCEAIEELIAQNIPINATLIFSPNQAKSCLDALERGYKKGDAVSVMSIFVSRFDRKLDSLLKAKGLEAGKVGIMNAAKIYNMIMHRNLEKLRPLFASTSVKGNDYPAHYYISELVAPKAINTAPLKTIQAFIKEGDKTPKLPLQDEEIERFFTLLKASGIDMKSVYYELLQEGLKAFEEAFEEILKELS